jgi:hypothetical protein
MIASKIDGRLGNNLFQIATAYSLALDNNDDFGMFVKHTMPKDIQSLQFHRSNIFKEIKEVTDTFFVYREPYFTYTQIPYHKDMLLQGFFQSEKYFKHNRNKILELFKNDCTEYVNNKYGKLLEQNTVSLHIRRGDYTHLQQVYSLCQKEYYLEALKFIPQDVTKIIFSDDIAWCKQTFGADVIYIENESDIVDLKIMSLCKHNIIANSSFSWWGAWLNTNEHKVVVAPKKWFTNGYNSNDLYCEGWNVI